MKKTLLSFILALLVLPVGGFAPLAAQATSFSTNTAIRGTSTDTVYWFATDGKRYVFPNAAAFYSWFPNFDSVRTISDSELYLIPIGGNVTYRPGAKLVKVTTDPKTYAVSRGGVLRHVTSESLASQLYGYDWRSKVHDIPDVYFTNYTVGSPIYNVSDYNVSNEYNGVSTPSDSLRGMTSGSSYSTGDLVLAVSRTSINPGEAVTLSVSNIPSYGSGYRLEIYDTRTNGIVRTCNLPMSYCDVTVYPQRNSTENSVQYYAVVRDASGSNIRNAYAQVVYFYGAGYSTGTFSSGSSSLSVDRTSVYDGDNVVLTATASNLNTSASYLRMELYRESDNALINTCYDSATCTFTQRVTNDGSNAIRFYVIVKNDANEQIPAAYSPRITVNGGTSQTGTLTLTSDRTSVTPGQTVTLNAYYSGTFPSGGRMVINQAGQGSTPLATTHKTCYSNSCSHTITLYSYSSGLTYPFIALVYDASGVIIAWSSTIHVTTSGPEVSSNDGVNYINGLVLNTDRTSINAGNVVRLTANAFNSGSWSYSGNRIEITDVRTGNIVKTCYDVSTCPVDVYPQAYSSTNLTAQYRAKIYDRNGSLVMSQYSPVIYLSSYSGSSYDGSNGYSLNGSGLITFAPSENLRVNRIIYLTGTFTGMTNLALADAQIQIFTELSSTPVATCVASYTCSVSFPTGTSPINTRTYARISDRNNTSRWLETNHTSLVTMW